MLYETSAIPILAADFESTGASLRKNGATIREKSGLRKSSLFCNLSRTTFLFG